MRAPEPESQTDAPRPTPAWICTPGLASLPFLRTFLPDYAPTLVPGPGTRAVLGWGQRRSGWAGRAWARRTKQPYVALEDGFLRSIGLGEQGAVGLSLMVDPVGVYYDARQPSALEQAMITAPDWCDAAMRDRAAALVGRIVGTGLSKTNLGEPLDRSVLRSGRRVLIIDQTFGDASIPGGLAGPEAFVAMLEAARAEEPGAQLIVKRHPAVAAGLKRSCLEGADLRDVTLIDGQVTPASLLAEVDVVYTVTSGVGFEALMRGLPVRCHGLPFYAGWGLTRDVLSSPRRGVPRDIETLAAAALIRSTRYVDPVRETPCTAEEAVERLLSLQRHAGKVAGNWAGLGFAPAKQAAVRRLVNGPASRLSYFESAPRAVEAAHARGGGLMIWAGKETAAASAAAAGFAGPVVRMEDGFIRSRGLGSDFVPASSVALDDLGIYYDPTRPSRLEALIQTRELDAAQLARAAALRQRVIQANVSKYNQGGEPLPPLPSGRQVILVVGQVEDDRSILLGCSDVRTNAGLVEAVRRDCPDAFLVWKNHPDVVSGNRRGRLGEAAAALVDLTVDHADINRCLDGCDTVATMTSLTGFEGLMRGRSVVTYGRPFYAGWGLTEDRLTFERRTRRVSLDHLVHVALIDYPIYVSPKGWPCEAEDMIDALSSADAPRPRGGLRRWFRALQTSTVGSRELRY